MSIAIRCAALQELQALSALCLRSKAVWGYDAAFLDACRDELTLLPEALASTQIAVAVVDTGLAGVAQTQMVRSEAHLLKLFIDPALLGRGIGRSLFGWASERARALAATRLVIEADPDAAPFYRRMGARDAGVAPSGSIAGRILPRLVLEL